MKRTLIRNAVHINEGTQTEADLLMENGKISQIGPALKAHADVEIDARGCYLLPGVIDDQVHFREPGLTHKGELATESRAAAAGGITSFMEMPNTKPQTLTQELLEQKYERAAAVSAVNYSFFMGASNDNLEEVLKTNPANVCGVKVFMGSSTGNMLVDDRQVLEKLFSQVPMLIATHCEKEEIVRANMQAALAKFGDHIPMEEHPRIRSREACYASSSLAVSLAKKYNTRLHVLHISTAEELDLFDNSLDLTEKRITAEACIHHLWFSDEDYAQHGVHIKWNPAVKAASDRAAIRQAVRDNRIDVIATDHAPHTLEEKGNLYPSCPSGGPLVQHSLPAMMSLVDQGVFSWELLVEKMAHSPAKLFRIQDRGYLREGYWGDVVLVEKNPWTVTKDNILYKCGWSPLEGTSFPYRVRDTFVNGERVYSNGEIDGNVRGKRLTFGE